MKSVLDLYDELNSQGVKFYHWDLGDDRAAVLELNGHYGVFADFSNIDTIPEEKVIIAHEGGHIATGATHTLNSPFDLISKHEYKADKWAIEKLIPGDELDAAVAAGCTTIWDLADHFGVTEDFMRKAVCYYVHGNMNTELYF